VQPAKDAANQAIANKYPTLVPTYAPAPLEPQVVFTVIGNQNVCFTVSQTVANRARKRGLFFLTLATLCGLGTPAQQQEAVPTSNHIVLGREFLRSLYPALNDKGYSMSISIAVNYDHPANRATDLELDVGEGPKDMVKGISFGCLGEQTKGCEPGPIHPKQHLTAFFTFEEDQLRDILCRGPALGNPDARCTEQAFSYEIEIIRRHF